jgi:hypothetical protein
VEKSSPTFIITRADQVVDPVTLRTQAVRVGRQLDCEILLNHPAVSPLHAGINEVDGRFYLINLSQSHPVTLNGRLVEFNESEALADGDVAQIGPFFLHMSRAGDALSIDVLFYVAPDSGASETATEAEQPELAQAPPMVADALKEFWDKRTRDKAARPSPLHPRQPPLPGKARFSWKPTRDLLRPWPRSLFVWGAVIFGVLSVAAAFLYAKAFSPRPISEPHARAALVQKTAVTAIAKQANAASCTSCHTLGGKMEANCASCHQTEAFASDLSGINAHAEAGIGCTSCHAEHQGADFLPAAAALNACAKCHSDGNRNLYHGRRVFTPHGGGFGYPVVNGVWKWKGLSEAEWQQKPDAATEAMKRARARLNGETEEQWRSRQFHVLHVQRVLARDVSLKGNTEGEMSCSSCHKSFAPIDRTTPATTCALCHNGQQPLMRASAANCSSCHIQHVKEPRHWNPKLLAERIYKDRQDKQD